MTLTPKKITTLLFMSLLLVATTLVSAPSAFASTTVKKEFQLFSQKKGTDSRIPYYMAKHSDKVTKKTPENRITYAALKKSAKTDNLDTIKAKLKKVQDSYNGVKGVKETLEFKGNYVLETVSINYKKADPNEVLALQGSQTDGNSQNKKIAYISYKLSAKTLKEQGYKAIKNGQFQTLQNLEE